MTDKVLKQLERTAIALEASEPYYQFVASNHRHPARLKMLTMGSIVYDSIVQDRLKNSLTRKNSPNTI
jgi:hypothetical protein